MASTIDPNEVRVTGENSFIRLGSQEGSEFTTRASHWRVLYSPAGPGHCLFLQSEITNDQVAVYSDNIALARWLQEEIEAMLYPSFADTSIPVIEATFERSGDVMSYITESVTTRDADLSLTWYNFMEPLAMHAPPGTGGRSHGVYTIFFPARGAQLSLDESFASGKPLPTDREGHEITSACLAWSETWVRPR